MRFRIGIGYDVHPLVPGRNLILGGVEVPFDKGLEGWFEVPISTISKRWPSINSVLVHDLELARALSTPSKTSSGKFVLVGRGRPLSSLDYFITYAFAIKVNVIFFEGRAGIIDPSTMNILFVLFNLPLI